MLNLPPYRDDIFVKFSSVRDPEDRLILSTVMTLVLASYGQPLFDQNGKAIRGSLKKLEEDIERTLIASKQENLLNQVSVYRGLYQNLGLDSNNRPTTLPWKMMPIYIAYINAKQKTIDIPSPDSLKKWARYKVAESTSPPQPKNGTLGNTRKKAPQAPPSPQGSTTNASSIAKHPQFGSRESIWWAIYDVLLLTSIILFLDVQNGLTKSQQDIEILQSSPFCIAVLNWVPRQTVGKNLPDFQTEFVEYLEEYFRKNRILDVKVKPISLPLTAKRDSSSIAEYLRDLPIDLAVTGKYAQKPDGTIIAVARCQFLRDQNKLSELERISTLLNPQPKHLESVLDIGNGVISGEIAYLTAYTIAIKETFQGEKKRAIKLLKLIPDDLKNQWEAINHLLAFNLRELGRCDSAIYYHRLHNESVPNDISLICYLNLMLEQYGTESQELRSEIDSIALAFPNSLYLKTFLAYKADLKNDTIKARQLYTQILDEESFTNSHPETAQYRVLRNAWLWRSYDDKNQLISKKRTDTLSVISEHTRMLNLFSKHNEDTEVLFSYLSLLFHLQKFEMVLQTLKQRGQSSEKSEELICSQFSANNLQLHTVLGPHGISRDKYFEMLLYQGELLEKLIRIRPESIEYRAMYSLTLSQISSTDIAFRVLLPIRWFIRLQEEKRIAGNAYLLLALFACKSGAASLGYRYSGAALEIDSTNAFAKFIQHTSRMSLVDAAINNDVSAIEVLEANNIQWEKSPQDSFPESSFQEIEVPYFLFCDEVIESPYVFKYNLKLDFSTDSKSIRPY